MADEKYVAPPWIKYPTSPRHSNFWKTGSGAEYLLTYKENVNDEEEYLKLFPQAPTFGEDITPADSLSQEAKDYLNSPSKPLFIKLWENDGKPKYDIKLDDRKNQVYMFDTLLFDKSSHIHIGTEKYDSANDIYELVKSEICDYSPEVWEELKYTVLINAVYFKIVSDINFTKELIKTKNRDILFRSENLELGVEELEDGSFRGNNVLGRAVMEIRDVVKDVYENYNLIDWDISGEPYSKEHCACLLH